MTAVKETFTTTSAASMTSSRCLYEKFWNFAEHKCQPCKSKYEIKAGKSQIQCSVNRLLVGLHLHVTNENYNFVAWLGK